MSRNRATELLRPTDLSAATRLGYGLASRLTEDGTLPWPTSGQPTPAEPAWPSINRSPVTLLGGEALIGSTMISLNNGSHDCLRPSLVPLPKIRLQKFVGQRFPRPPHYRTPTYPTLSNFGLAIADSVVLPLQISCDSEASDWDGSWIVPLSSDRLLTNYDNSGVILVLERHIAPEPIKPSFPCYKARSVAERAIRASAALAGYDRSIAAAYQWALKLATGDDLTELRHEQADWLKTRNACGSDAECLAKSMRNRADLLMQQ